MSTADLGLLALASPSTDAPAALSAKSNDELLGEYHRPRINGLDFKTWKHLVNVASIIGRMGEPITVEAIKEYSPAIHIDLISKVISTPEFASILEYRGVLPDDSPVGMTERQMMAIHLLTNFSDIRPIKTKLKSIGVTESEFQQWLSTSGRFKRVYRKLSEQLFDEAQGAVNVALAQIATNGDLRAIKYFNEVSGRYDPAAKNVADVRTVISAVVDVISSTIQDPELLAQIVSRLSAVMVQSGLAGNNHVPEPKVIDAFKEPSS